jgi:hypothetical protein
MTEVTVTHDDDEAAATAVRALAEGAGAHSVTHEAGVTVAHFAGAGAAQAFADILANATVVYDVEVTA